MIQNDLPHEIVYFLYSSELKYVTYCKSNAALWLRSLWDDGKPIKGLSKLPSDRLGHNHSKTVQEQTSDFASLNFISVLYPHTIQASRKHEFIIATLLAHQHPITMGLINVRELLAFPAGDNSSDTLIGGIHWNLTTLQHWNYTYYSNGTFSNGSLCFLLFEPYTPHLLANGTFLNSTSCYSPISPMGLRSIAGLIFSCIFAFSIMFTFINLRKHGRLFLPTEKRFRAIGRRWQWYWMLAVAAFAMISGITDVDVDRYYLPELPIVLANFFWFLMLPTTMAVVWESVRHWGSWQERQMVDPNPFLLRQDDRRSKVEFYLPLVFYFFFWMVSLL